MFGSEGLSLLIYGHEGERSATPYLGAVRSKYIGCLLTRQSLHRCKVELPKHVSADGRSCNAVSEDNE